MMEDELLEILSEAITLLDDVADLIPNLHGEDVGTTYDDVVKFLDKNKYKY